MTDEQTVVETEAVAEPTVEDNSAPDLEALLSEYEQETQVEQQAQPSEPQTPDPDRLNQVYSYVEQQQRQAMERETNEAIANSVKTIKDGMEMHLPDNVIEGYLEQMARKDSRIANAFLQRDKNPQGWNNVLKGVQRAIVNDFNSLPDPKVNEDRQAVAAAVRSASTKQQQTDDFDEKKVRGMSANDLYAQFPELTRNF